MLRELFSRIVDARFACNRPDVYCRKRRSSTSYLFVAQRIYLEWMKFAKTISIVYKWTNYDEKSPCRHNNVYSLKSLLIKLIVLPSIDIRYRFDHTIPKYSSYNALTIISD